MSRRVSIQRLLAIALALGLLASHPVFAACASPYGLAGNTQVGTGGTLYKCDGTNWNAAASLPSLASTDVWVGNISNVATATATTGTGNVVLSTSPALTGAPTAPTQSTGDTSTDIANDAFVHNVVNASSGPSAQNDVTASRALATVYNNTGSKPLFVEVSVYAGTGGGIWVAYSDTSSSPATAVGYLSLSAHYYGALFFIVLPGAYYKVATANGSGSLTSWLEWQ